MTGKKVTIRDIANYLDVSVTTVSFALNNKGDISEETRNRIKEVAGEMGYRPDHLARSLVTGVSHTVGVIIPDVSNQFFAETVRYLQKKFAVRGCEFEVLQVGQKIKALEKDFTPAVALLEQADVLLFSYPVYTFIAPYQLHRFIELMKEHKVQGAGKYATQITTSKHF